MDVRQTELYQRIQQFSLDAIDTNLPFSRRLARDNRWTLDYAQRVIDEYKKFVFLAIAAGHPVTPSDPVDQVWHLHLLYTQSYWEEFCPKVLQKPLHHNPTKGGQQERGKFNDWYSGTLRSYEAIFQQSPPVDIWSPPQVRFGRDLAFVRINTQKNWILPKPDLNWVTQHLHPGLIGLFGLLILSIGWSSPSWATSAAATQVSNFTVWTFFPIYLWVAGTSLSTIITVNLLLLRFDRRFWLGAPLFSSIWFGLFGIGSVRSIAGLTTLPGSEFLGFFGLSAIAGILADFILHGWVEAQLFRLQHKGKGDWKVPATYSALRTASLLVLLCVVGLDLLGISRIGLGLYRQQPIGYLALLCIGLALYLRWRLNRFNRQPFILKVGILATIVALMLLSGFTMAQFRPLMFVGAVWLLLQYSSKLTKGNGWTGSSSGTTCVNGDCGGSGDVGGGSDGGCGGCGG